MEKQHVDLSVCAAIAACLAKLKHNIRVASTESHAFVMCPASLPTDAKYTADVVAYLDGFR